MMIGGACFSLFAVLMLEYEGEAGRRAAMRLAQGPFVRFLRYLSCGGLLIGLSVYQIEYDFGVRAVPAGVAADDDRRAAAAGGRSSPASRWAGRGDHRRRCLRSRCAAGSPWWSGRSWGPPINWFPLYLGPALVVELLALTPLFKRPILFGAVAGLGVGTVGLWVESLWIGAVYHYPWPASMWGEALAMAVPVAVLTGICGALFGMVLTGQRLPGRAIGISVVAARCW